MSEIKTLQSIEAEEQALMAELTGLEAELLKMHDREWEIRKELAHLNYQRKRIQGLPTE